MYPTFHLVGLDTNSFYSGGVGILYFWSASDAKWYTPPWQTGIAQEESFLGPGDLT